MTLFSKFKKDYLNYLISIILPALISGLSIPIFKHLLGAKGYGEFSIWFNGLLIVTAVLTGWIAQSIIRYYPASADKEVFSRNALTLSFKTQLIFFIPAFFIVLYIKGDVFFSSLFALTLFVTSIQFTILPIIQSSFLSKKIIFSETIRTVSYVGFAVMLLLFMWLPYLYSLFISVAVSYLFTVVYLIKQASKFFRNQRKTSKHGNGKTFVFKDFFKYGAPLSFWFVFAYLLSYIDKLFMNQYSGAEAQGNYQAIFDLLSRSLTLLITPVVTSLFPILTTAYESKDRPQIRQFLRKIIGYELIGFLIVSICYWWFGTDLLILILKVPDTFSFKLMGFIVICGTFVWQLAILAQKRFELREKSKFLLAMVIVAFIVQIVFYLLFKDSQNQLIYPLGFLLSATVYLTLVSMSEILLFIKKKRI